MEGKQHKTEKSGQRKLSNTTEKNKKSSRKKKKSQSRKLFSKSDSTKDSDPRPEGEYGLEIEGVGVLNHAIYADSDLSHRSSLPQIHNEYQVDTSQPCGVSSQTGDIRSSTSSSLDRITEESDSNLNVGAKTSSLSTLQEEKVLNDLVDLSLKHKAVDVKLTRMKITNSNIDFPNQNGATRKKMYSSNGNSAGINTANVHKFNESLRWECILDEQEKESERIQIYKMKRRKRYLAAAHAKGLGWVVNYTNNGSPLSEDSGMEIRETMATVTDYSTMHRLATCHSNSVLNNISFIDF